METIESSPSLIISSLLRWLYFYHHTQPTHDPAHPRRLPAAPFVCSLLAQPTHPNPQPLIHYGSGTRTFTIPIQDIALTILRLYDLGSLQTKTWHAVQGVETIYTHDLILLRTHHTLTRASYTIRSHLVHRYATLHCFIHNTLCNAYQCIKSVQHFQGPLIISTSVY